MPLPAKAGKDGSPATDNRQREPAAAAAPGTQRKRQQAPMLYREKITNLPAEP